MTTISSVPMLVMSCVQPATRDARQVKNKLRLGQRLLHIGPSGSTGDAQHIMPHLRKAQSQVLADKTVGSSNDDAHATQTPTSNARSARPLA